MKHLFSRFSWMYITSVVLFVLVPFIYILLHNDGQKLKAGVNTAIKDANENFVPSHLVSLPGNRGNLAFRNRPLSNREFTLVADPASLEGKKINNDTWVGTLGQGDRVQLLDQIGLSYKIRVKSGVDGKLLEGYIAITVNGKPTIEPL
jgi:hypothetical protein